MRKFSYFILVIALILFAVLFFYSVKNKSEVVRLQNSKTHSLTQVHSLVHIEQNTVSSVGRAKNIYIMGNTNDLDIIGYDFIIQYNPDVLKFISATSLQSGIQIFQKKKKGELIVTGVRKLGEKNTPITLRLLEIIFEPQKKGKTIVSLLSESGKLRSQLVDSSSKSQIIESTSLELAIQ